MYTKYSNIWFSNVINHACVLCVIHIHSSLSIYYDYDHDYKFFYLFCLHWARWDKPKNKKTKRLMMTLDFFLIHIIVRWTGVSSCMSCGIRVSGTVRAVSVSDCAAGHPTARNGKHRQNKKLGTLAGTGSIRQCHSVDAFFVCMQPKRWLRNKYAWLLWLVTILSCASRFPITPLHCWIHDNASSSLCFER